MSKKVMDLSSRKSFSERLKGWIEVKKRMLSANDRVVVVGAPNSPSEADGLTQGQLMMIHEFGAPDAGIPERPILRSTLRAEAAGATKRLAKDVKAVIRGNMTGEKALQRVGLYLEGRVKNNFGKDTYGGTSVPLLPETIKRKGSSAALIDTGSLRASITSKVVKRGELDEVE